MRKQKVLTPEQQEEIRTKDFFDMILPSTVKFMSDAYENTKRVHKPIIRPLEDVMLYTMFKEHEGINLEEIPERDGTPLLPLYMLTNSEEKRGAVSMLYPEELEKLAEKMNSDLYIMPASVDMVLVTNTLSSDYNEAETVYRKTVERFSRQSRDVGV